MVLKNVRVLSAISGPTSIHHNAVIQPPRMYATALFSAMMFLRFI